MSLGRHYSHYAVFLKMEHTVQSGILAFLLDSMFQYGMLWIFIENLEEVKIIMQANQQNLSLIGEAIARGYQRMAALHAKVQSIVWPFHLQHGYCDLTGSKIVIDDEMD